MVEMAILLPVLLLLVFGIIEFGRLYHNQVTLTHAAREGIRFYAITQDAPGAEAVAENAATALDPSLMTISTSACNPGEPATMSISYPFQLSIPFFGNNALTIVAEGVMRCGG